MHELGIVIHVIRTLEETAEENNIVRIGSVTLSVGEVSGVVEEQLRDCWDYFKTKKDLVKDAVLKLETVPAVTFCTNCRKDYETLRYGKTCPYCDSPETYLVQGNEFFIKEIEAETTQTLGSLALRLPSGEIDRGKLKP